MVEAPLYSAEIDALPGDQAGAGRRAGIALNIPNLITLGRILLVPVVVWAIASGAMWIAFVLFLAAGVSDAIDGFLAKRFGMATELGAYLDPLADKALIVSIYLTLGVNGLIPRWLVILVVSRDILIVARHHQDHQPARDQSVDAEGKVDRDDQRLVGERIEIGTQFGGHAEALGEKAVDGVAHAGGQEQHEGNPHRAGRDRPDHDRHQQNAPQRYEVRNIQGNPGSSTRSGLVPRQRANLGRV